VVDRELARASLKLLLMRVVQSLSLHETQIDWMRLRLNFRPVAER
jgi:hypothetical protein